MNLNADVRIRKNAYGLVLCYNLWRTIFKGAAFKANFTLINASDKSDKRDKTKDAK